jgi:hypothetical protein
MAQDVSFFFPVVPERQILGLPIVLLNDVLLVFHTFAKTLKHDCTYW